MSYLRSPADILGMRRGEWYPTHTNDHIIQTAIERRWVEPGQSDNWQLCSLSSSICLYQERTRGRSFVVKYYSQKVGPESPDIERYVRNEYERICEARALMSGWTNECIVRPIDVWRGALILEYVNGITIADLVAIRRSQPGALSHAIGAAGGFLAKLHLRGRQPQAPFDIGKVQRYAHKIIARLTSDDFLAVDPLIVTQLYRLVDAWCTRPQMEHAIPCYAHGDPTTANFIVGAKGGVIALDWENAYLGDPASDLGIFQGELTFSMQRNGLSLAEMDGLREQFLNAYLDQLPPSEQAEELLWRANYYQGVNLLRIANNAHLDKAKRYQLVAHALCVLLYLDQRA